MKKHLALSTVSALFLSAVLAPAAAAAPVDCTAGVCSVSDGGASIATTSSSEKDLQDVFLNGIEHLDEDEFHICLGLSAATDCDVSTVVSATMDEVANTIVANFSEAGFDFTVTWTLDGSTPNQAIVDKQLIVTNTSGASLDLTVLDYTGWDLFDDGTGDTALSMSSSILRQSQAGVTVDSVATTAADFFAVHNCTFSTNCEDIFASQNSGGDLNNNAGPVSPMPEYAWQNNVTLAIAAAITINRQLVVTSTSAPGATATATGPATPVPTLPTVALFLLVFILVAVVFLGRRGWVKP